MAARQSPLRRSLLAVGEFLAGAPDAGAGFFQRFH
jgi:hypothetical protein